MLVVQKALLIYDVYVVLHALVLRKDLWRTPEGLDGQVLLLLRVVVAAQIKSFLALEFLIRNPVWTWTQFVIKRTEQLLDQSVRELAI